MPPVVFMLVKKAGLPIALVLVGMVAGGWSVYKLYHLGQVRELKQLISEKNKRHIQDMTLVAEHHQKAIIIERDKVKIKEIVKYVKDNRECDLSPDAVRLLDESRQGVSESTSRTAESAGTVTEPIGIPQSIEVQAHADCGIRYRQLAEQLTALIKWHRLTAD